jgi:pilus assembly protein CpaB
MLTRGVLLGLGMLALLAGLALSVLWFRQSSAPPTPVATELPASTILVAAHAMPAGMLLRIGDMAWEEVPAAAVASTDTVRGTASETDFVGAATRRAFAAREHLIASELAKPGDREFLIAALGPGFRAVSINVDAVQSTAGLLLPGDRVDVILTQTLAPQSADAAHRTVGETVLHDLRVIAVDQTLSPASKPGDVRNTLGELHMPKTVTLEVTERQASMLLVADQLGKVQLALRGQRDQSAKPVSARLLTRDESLPIWASDVSKALVQPVAAPLAAIPETARAEIAIIRGSKTERLCESPTGLAPCK